MKRLLGLELFLPRSGSKGARAAGIDFFPIKNYNDSMSHKKKVRLENVLIVGHFINLMLAIKLPAVY
ncbi:MAG: hypothetical protein KAW12_19895 [Candidatus Aminicenantes bacterium]|nr:hypothetical protein [Candidatus Aminicenantes bacterium]